MKETRPIDYVIMLGIVAVIAITGVSLFGGDAEQSLEGITNFDALVVDSLTSGEIVSDEIVFGANDLYPLGYATDGQQLVYGTDVITGTLALDHGLSTVTFAMCNLGEDPDAAAGAGAHCTVTVAANVATAKVWQDDFVTAATETSVDVHWIVVGEP